MASALPDGDAAPSDGRLPARALASLPGTDFGLYLHVPFCAARCGYCDFNTYTLAELGQPGSAAHVGLDTYVGVAIAELDLAARVLGHGEPECTVRRVNTVFVGGGTPTLLAVSDLARLLDAVRHRWPLAPDVEVTTEANPDTLTPEVAAGLARAGFTRVSIGMQSSVPHVLATLDRTHRPANVTRAVQAVRAAGLQVSLDLIYGTPGESLVDWRTSLSDAVSLRPDHISAYALVVEEGTKLAAQVRRGEVRMPSDDDEADKYEVADDILGSAGYRWYEVSNWSLGDASRCRHNDLYWRSANWWGIGPGAHSHVGGVRWWNVKHPSAYAQHLVGGRSPAAAREVLSADQQRDEEVLLGIRRREGVCIDGLTARGRAALAGVIADGLLDETAAQQGWARLTLRGRLLADVVVRALTA